MKIFFDYYKDNSTGGFYHEGVQDAIPESAVEITQEQYEFLLSGLNSGKLVYIDKDGNYQLREPLTKLVRGKWVADDEAITKIAQDKLIADARILLAENDFRWNNQIRWIGYTEEQKQALTDYYTALLAVVNGESNTLPILSLS